MASRDSMFKLIGLDLNDGKLGYTKKTETKNGRSKVITPLYSKKQSTLEKRANKYIRDNGFTAVMVEDQYGNVKGTKTKFDKKWYR